MAENIMLPDHIFRGYDIRGLVESEISDEGVAQLGKAYATWLLDRRIYDCVLAMDCRLSSPRFRDILAKELTEAGITVYDIGMAMTQVAYFAQYYFRSKGLIMITASHNPKEYNGFKFGTGFSETMVSRDILAFRDLLRSGAFHTRKEKGKHIVQSVDDAYLDDVLRRSGTMKPLKIVIDACHGTAGPLMIRLLEKIGCELIVQYCEPDGNFPVGTPDPTEEVVQRRLAKRVVEEGADLGFSFDCDGDRLGVVGHKGNLIWNDTLVAIYAKDILDFLPGSKIVYNALCSKQVDDVIRDAGGDPIMWLTGHSFIKEKVRNEGAVFGGELSGHFFFMDNFYGHDDTAIGMLRLLEYMTRIDQSLEEIVASLPQYVSSPEIKVGCPDDIKFDVVSQTIGDKIKALYPDARYTEIDGVRMDTADEMLIVRASQNGPYLTVKFEGKTEEKYALLRDQIREILENTSEVDFGYGVNVEALRGE